MVCCEKKCKPFRPLFRSGIATPLINKWEIIYFETRSPFPQISGPSARGRTFVDFNQSPYPTAQHRFRVEPRTYFLASSVWPPWPLALWLAPNIDHWDSYEPIEGIASHQNCVWEAFLQVMCSAWNKKSTRSCRRWCNEGLLHCSQL